MTVVLEEGTHIATYTEKPADSLLCTRLCFLLTDRERERDGIGLQLLVETEPMNLTFL